MYQFYITETDAMDTLNWSLYYICHSAEVLCSNPSRGGCSLSGSVYIQCSKLPGVCSVVYGTVHFKGP